MPIENMKPIKQYYGLIVGATAVKLDAIAPVPSNAQAAVITVETNPIRSRIDDTDPTTIAGGGRTLERGERIIYGNDQMKKMRLIRDGSAQDSMITVEYFGE